MAIKSTSVKEKLKGEVLISEAYLTALFWNNPENYLTYSGDKLNTKSFLNPVWGFFFGLARHMREEKHIQIFDDISVMKHVKELGVEKQFDKYGGLETIRDVQDEVDGFEDNLEAYYKEVQKYNLIVELVDLFSDKVITTTDKYDYKKMSYDQLHTYWLDKVNKLAIGAGAKFERHSLLKGIRERAKQWDKNPSIGLPFYQSRLWTQICTGWELGCLYIYGGFGGSGKTSVVFNKIIMSCIEKREKLLIIANEQGIDDFQKLLVVTALGIKKEFLKRQRLNEGEFHQDEWDKIEGAIDWIEKLAGIGENSDGDDDVVEFAFMEDYIISDVKKIIRHYANRGYNSVLIDTGKPSEGDGAFSMARWERFTEDFKELYKMCRPNGGGMNLRLWINVQLADNALTRRFLNVDALGDSKKIKNEATVVFMGRALWDDEYAGMDNALKCWKFVKTDKNNPFHDEDKEYSKEEFELERFYTDSKGHKHENIYYVVFTPKNRRGKDNKMGQDILILRANLNSNEWIECGWTKIFDDKAY